MLHRSTFLFAADKLDARHSVYMQTLHCTEAIPNAGHIDASGLGMATDYYICTWPLI